MTESDIKFVEDCLREFASGKASSRALKVLDFGCGEGQLVRALRDRGYDAFGCDIARRWPDSAAQFAEIEQHPYRLPFGDESFDIVFSTGVFEHVLNKEESLLEIARVLKTGGVTLHIFPSKYFLPREPHLFVPFLNFFLPGVPTWYLTAWALLGVRNSHQRDMSWREVVAENSAFCRERLSYWSAKQYERCLVSILGNCIFPVDFLARHSNGRSARVLRSAIGARLAGQTIARFRYQLLVARKQDPRQRAQAAQFAT
jgi:SAM-dependent methyltransferase